MEALSYNDWGNRVVQLVTLRLARARTLTLALTRGPDPDPGADHDPDSYLVYLSLAQSP